MDNQREPFPQPRDRSVVDRHGSRNPFVAIGERGTHDRDRESVSAVGGHQDLFDGDLLLRVIPEGIAQRSLLGHDVVARRFLVDGGRTDEDVLFCPPREQADVLLRLVGLVGDEVDDRVKRTAGQGGTGPRPESE